MQQFHWSCLLYAFISGLLFCLSLLQVAVQVKPVYSPPQLLPIGKETITYIATDRSGNQANCSFTVTVVGELTLLGTASEQTMDAACGRWHVSKGTYE